MSFRRPLLAALLLLSSWTEAQAEVRSISLYPNSDSETSEHHLSPGIFAAWDALDDNPADSDLTYIFNAADQQLESTRLTIVGLQVPAEKMDNIFSLRCEALAGGNSIDSEAPNAARVAILLPDADGVPQIAAWSESYSLPTSPLLTRYETISVTATANLDGGPLTIDDVARAHCGVETTSTRSTGNPEFPNQARVTQVRLVVTFE
ncbi:MAG: hypothetical protein ACREA0_04195 [bacterium]